MLKPLPFIMMLGLLNIGHLQTETRDLSQQEVLNIVAGKGSLQTTEVITRNTEELLQYLDIPLLPDTKIVAAALPDEGAADVVWVAQWCKGDERCDLFNDYVEFLLASGWREPRHFTSVFFDSFDASTTVKNQTNKGRFFCQESVPLNLYGDFASPMTDEGNGWMYYEAVRLELYARDEAMFCAKDNEAGSQPIANLSQRQEVKDILPYLDLPDEVHIVEEMGSGFYYHPDNFANTATITSGKRNFTAEQLYDHFAQSIVAKGWDQTDIQQLSSSVFATWQLIDAKGETWEATLAVIGEGTLSITWVVKIKSN
jgi:hypothetical protein